MLRFIISLILFKPLSGKIISSELKYHDKALLKKLILIISQMENILKNPLNKLILEIFNIITTNKNKTATAPT